MDYESMSDDEVRARLDTLNKEFESTNAWDTEKWTVLALEINELEEWLEWRAFCRSNDVNDGF